MILIWTKVMALFNSIINSGRIELRNSSIGYYVVVRRTTSILGQLPLLIGFAWFILSSTTLLIDGFGICTKRQITVPRDVFRKYQILHYSFHQQHQRQSNIIFCSNIPSAKKSLTALASDRREDDIDDSNTASNKILAGDDKVRTTANDRITTPSSSRRSVLVKSAAILSSTMIAPLNEQNLQRNNTQLYANAAEIVSTPTPSSTMTMDATDAVITHKVFMKVRISRQDGTFYIRDEENDTNTSPDNQVYTGQLVIGLFGKNAPNHVERFLSYLNPTVIDDNPMPSYSRSLFTKFDQATGILTAGVIPSLEVTELNGSNVIKYGGRLLPASLWLEKGPTLPRIRHTGKGLLTHTLLDPTPTFGITTRSDTSALDRSNIVFGKIVLDDSSNDFLSRIVSLPTYSIDRPVTSVDDSIVDDAAELIFNAQREFFRGAAKSFGDTRISKVYEGKLLRRVEVTQVGIVQK